MTHGPLTCPASPFLTFLQEMYVFLLNQQRETQHGWRDNETMFMLQLLLTPPHSPAR